MKLGPRRKGHKCLKCESGSSRFQPGEGPSRGLLRAYEPPDGTFSSTSGYNEDPVPRVARLCFLPSVGTALARMCASLDTFPRNACSRTLQPDIGSTFVTGIHLLYVILTCLR